MMGYLIMAFNEEQWQRARGYYEAGLSLSQIKDKTGIARNTISQKAKKEQWEQGRNADYIEAREIIAVKKGTEKEQSIVCADEVADEKIRHKKLIYGNAEKLAEKLMIMADQVDQAQDMRHLVEANDKLSITLKVNERFAPKTEITNTNATQNNTKRVTIARRSDRT
jgi:predicted DNA-binding protein YlxM (UPF0122 family)